MPSRGSSGAGSDGPHLGYTDPSEPGLQQPLATGVQTVQLLHHVCSESPPHLRREKQADTDVSVDVRHTGRQTDRHGLDRHRLDRHTCPEKDKTDRWERQTVQKVTHVPGDRQKRPERQTERSKDRLTLVRTYVMHNNTFPSSQKTSKFNERNFHYFRFSQGNGMTWPIKTMKVFNTELSGKDDPLQKGRRQVVMKTCAL